MPVFFRVKDPRGIIINCSSEQWERHIAADHEMMVDNVQAIKNTLMDPDYIHESHDSNPPADYRQAYTRSDDSATYGGRFYTRVIARIDGGYGDVITAYPCKTATSGAKEGQEALYVAERSGKNET